MSTPPLATYDDRDEHGYSPTLGKVASALARHEGYRQHTVQWMPDPERFEVIYCISPRCHGPNGWCSKVERCGCLEALIRVEPDGSLTLERR